MTMSGEADTLAARWRMLAVLFLARTALGFQFQTIASTAPFLERALGIGSTEIGTAIGLYMLAGVFLALPGGLLVRRFGDKSLCCAGLGLMVFGGVLCGLAESFGLLATGRLISGTGGVLLGLSVTKMTTDWFAGRELVTAMAVLLTSWPLGIAAGLLIFPLIAQSQGWPWAMHLAAALSLIGLLVVALAYRSPEMDAGAKAVPMPSILSFPPAEETLPVLVAGVIWGAFNLGLIVLFSFTPLFLVAEGYTLAQGASITSLVLWTMMISIPLGGHLAQKSGRPDFISSCSRQRLGWPWSDW
jgi:MFS family permease